MGFLKIHAIGMWHSKQRIRNAIGINRPIRRCIDKHSLIATAMILSQCKIYKADNKTYCQKEFFHFIISTSTRRLASSCVAFIGFGYIICSLPKPLKSILFLLMPAASKNWYTASALCFESFFAAPELSLPGSFTYPFIKIFTSGLFLMNSSKFINSFCEDAVKIATPS